MLFRRQLVVAFFACVLALTACGDIHTDAHARPPTPTTRFDPVRPSTTTTTVDARPWYRAVDEQRWGFGVLAGKNAAAARIADALVPSSNGRKASTRDAAPAAAAPVDIAAINATGERCAYAGLIRSVWRQDAEWAVGIATRESNCQPDAVSPDHALGVFQLLGHADDFRAVGCDPSQWSDPSCNVRAAWHLYQRAGRQPWHL